MFLFLENVHSKNILIFFLFSMKHSFLLMVKIADEVNNTL